MRNSHDNNLLNLHSHTNEHKSPNLSEKIKKKIKKDFNVLIFVETLDYVLKFMLKLLH